MLESLIALQLWIALGLVVLFSFQRFFPHDIRGFTAIESVLIAFFWPAWSMYFGACIADNRRRRKELAAQQKESPNKSLN